MILIRAGLSRSLPPLRLRLLHRIVINTATARSAGNRTRAASTWAAQTQTKHRHSQQKASEEQYVFFFNVTQSCCGSDFACSSDDDSAAHGINFEAFLEVRPEMKCRIQGHLKIKCEAERWQDMWPILVVAF